MRDFENAKELFDFYIKKFDMKNKRINRKYYHTYRVVEYAREIANSENLNEDDFYIASVCALFHDIARFKQEKQYGTFDDQKSFDHGDEGYNILLEEDFISKLELSEEEKQIVLKVVKDHNKLKIPEGLSVREEYFLKLIKDADKLDIMDILGNTVTDGLYDLPDELINAVNEKRLVVTKNIDFSDIIQVFVTMCFIFDINFKISFEIIKEKQIIERKLEAIKEAINPEQFKAIEKNVLEEIQKQTS